MARYVLSLHQKGKDMATSAPRKIWQTLGAIKTGVILLILVVILSAAGTVILQRPATEADEMLRAHSVMFTFFGVTYLLPGMHAYA